MEDCYKLHSRKCLNQVIFHHRAAQAFLEENWDSSTETSFSKPEVYIYLGYQFTLLEFHLNIQWKYVWKANKIQWKHNHCKMKPNTNFLEIQVKNISEDQNIYVQK